MRVIIEREVWERTTVHGVRAMRPRWVRAWTGEVLYADRLVVLVRSAGSHQKFYGVPRLGKSPRGIGASMWGYDPKHRDVVRLNLPKDRWGRLVLGAVRISPKSAEDLRLTMRGGGVSFLTRTHQSVMRLHREMLRLPGLRVAVAPGRSRIAKAAALPGKKKACKPVSKKPRPAQR